MTGWEYFPSALGLGVRKAWKRSGGVPIFVTENGIATADDTRRIDYTSAALTGLHQAIADGVDVLGYLHWSALDNYEWGSYATTFAHRGRPADNHPEPETQPGLARGRCTGQ